jgi:transcription antitermination factor NusG
MSSGGSSAGGATAAADAGEVMMATFRLGDAVRIKSGAFAAFTGRIEGINRAKRLLKVLIDIFGRTTPTKSKFSDVEKVSFRLGQ